MMTFLSRILGLVRDTLVAQIYGVNASVDAFYVAYKIPNFMRNLFAEGCFSQAFVPVLSEYKCKKNHDEVRTFISHIAGSLGSVLTIITLLGVIGTPFVVMAFAPGYVAGTPRFEWAAEMLRITFPYLLLVSMTALSGAVLNSYGVFGVPAFTPVLLNIVMIAAALWLSPHLHIPVEAQAWGVLVAGFVQFAFQMPFVYRLGFLVRPRLSWKDPGVQRVLKLMLPALFGASIGQISLLINTIFASFLKVGSFTWLYNSERLAYFPLGVFGVALATVVLPHLSAKHANKSDGEFAKALDWGVRCNILIGLPASITMVVLAGPMVASLFQYGKFTAYDVLMTRLSVWGYAVGLLSFMLVKVLTAGFYARQDVKTPVRIGIVAIICNIVLNATLIWPLAHAGLALAASLSSWINTILLLIAMYRKEIYRVQPGWIKFGLQVLFANGVMTLLLWWGGGHLTTWLSWGWRQRLLHLTLLGMGAIVVYVASLWMAGIRLRDLRVESQ